MQDKFNHDDEEMATVLKLQNAAEVYCAAVCVYAWNHTEQHPKTTPKLLCTGLQVHFKRWQTEFANMGCSSKAAGGQIRVAPNVIDSSGARRQTLLAERRRSNEQVQEQERLEEIAQSTRSGRTDAELQAELGTSLECKKATREWDRQATDARGEPRYAEPQRVAMYAACGVREPDKVVNVVVNPVQRRSAPAPAFITQCRSNHCYDSNGNLIWR